MRRLPVLIAGALLATSVLIPQSADAATSSHPRITTLLATSQYIVYRQRTSTSNLRPDGSTPGSIFATDITGQRMTLPGFSNAHQRLYLTGSMLVQPQNTLHTTADRQTIRYLDLNTRQGGTWTGQPNEIVLGAAPDGWLMEESTGIETVNGTVEQVTYVHRDGTRVDLGRPFPDGQDIGLTISDTGIVATPGVSDETSFHSQVVYQAWRSLGTSWRTLYTAPDVQVSISCAPSSSTHVACVRAPEEGEGEGPYTPGLISLNGSGSTWLADTHPHACRAIQFATLGSNLVGIETTDAGVCTKGKLYRYTAKGGLVSGGTHHYSSTGILTGLGGASGGSAKIVVSSLDQRHIDTLTGVTRAPHVLVRV